MPAVNMAGALVVPANPAAGKPVLMSPFSGPKNSPFDARVITGWVAGRPTYANDPTNFSTGALSTGIGFGYNSPIIGLTAPQSIKDRGFTDDYAPGGSTPVPAAASNSRFVAIGGGKSAIVAGTGAGGNGSPANENVSSPVPYVAGFALQAFGDGGSRDAGAGPVFTGFGLKMVTATGAVAIGAAIEAGFLNRTPRALVTGESAHGSASAASAALA